MSGLVAGNGFQIKRSQAMPLWFEIAQGLAPLLLVLTYYYYAEHLQFRVYIKIYSVLVTEMICAMALC